MKRYHLTPLAKADLVAIYEEIRQDRPMAARRVVAEIRETMRRLAQMPGIGHTREDLTDDDTLRFRSVYSFLIVYRISPLPIQVIRVLHGARDVRRVLGRTT